MTPLPWIKTRNVFLKKLLKVVQVLTHKMKKHEKTKINAFAHLIEQIYYARNVSLIAPFVFKRNLELYSITNSKELTTMTKK